MIILLRHLKKTELIVALGLLLVVPVLQYSPVLLECLVSKNISFVEMSPMIWEADLSSLDPGRYYLSVGRPHGSCELSLNGRVLSSTKGDLSAIRPQLILGAGFEVLANSSAKRIIAKVACEKQDGFPPRLHHQPVVASFFSGFILQSARIFIDLVMGPLASLLLLLSIFLSTPRLSEDLKINRHYIIFAVAALLYSASLAQVGSLFLGGVGFTVLHIVLRTSFSAAFVYLGSNYSKPQNKLLLIHFIVAVAAVLEGLFASSRLEALYNIQFAMFPISSFIVTLDLIRSSHKARMAKTLISLGIAWTVLQCVDYVNMIFLDVPYLAPAFIAIIALIVAVVRYRELTRVELKAQKAIAKARAAAEVAQLSAKIAHDVRSPLALLKVLSRDESMPDDLKKLLIAASDRIRGIADTLLEKNRELHLKHQAPSKATHSVARQETSLVDLISNVVEEKRRLTESVQIRFIDKTGGILLGRVDPLEFSRLLSNLIDNAIEAVDANGEIAIISTADSEHAQVLIKDNGRGIPAQMLPKLFEYGATFGKSNGNGLGLFSAKKAVEAWGGSIKVSSTVGQGTEVSINLISGL